MYLIFLGIKHDNNQALDYLQYVTTKLDADNVKEYGKKFFETELEYGFRNTGFGSTYVGKDWLNIYDVLSRTAHYFELQDPYALKPIISYYYKPTFSIAQIPESETEFIEVFSEN